MKAPTDYFAWIESFDETTTLLRGLSDADKEAASAQMMDLGLDLFLRAGDSPRALEKVCVWHADRFYRLVNQLDVLDTASFVFLRAVGRVFSVVMKQRKLSVAYVVDNEVPVDRLLGIQAAFQSLGFVVASPELLAMKLVGDDGQLEGVRDESMMLARRLFRESIDVRLHVLWVSGGATLAELQSMVGALDDAPYIGVFRNDAPVQGSKVQIFRSGGASEKLSAQGT